MRLFVFWVLALFMFVGTSCEDEGGSNDYGELEETTFDYEGIRKDSITKVIYRFSDSSVPPKFHRSYKIAVTKNTIIAIVDVYGDVIADKEYAFDEIRFKELLAKTDGLPESGGKLMKGASGTMGYTVMLFEGNKDVYKLFWDNLVETPKGGKEFVEYVKGLVPDLEALLDTPYEGGD